MRINDIVILVVSVAAGINFLAAIVYLLKTLRPSICGIAQNLVPAILCFVLAGACTILLIIIENNEKEAVVYTAAEYDVAKMSQDIRIKHKTGEKGYDYQILQADGPEDGRVVKVVKTKFLGLFGDFYEIYKTKDADKSADFTDTYKLPDG